MAVKELERVAMAGNRTAGCPSWPPVPAGLKLLRGSKDFIFSSCGGSCFHEDCWSGPCETVDGK
jgi:hypothetical protein